MNRWGVGRIAAAVVVMSALGMTSGCALLSPPRSSAATPTATATTDAAPTDAAPPAQKLPYLLVEGQTVGTGRLEKVPHDPVDDPRAEHPLTGDVTVVVNDARRLEVRIRPDDPATTDIRGLDLIASGTRYDGRPENVGLIPRFSLTSDLSSVTTDGELVLPLATDFPSLGDPTFLHSIEVSPAADARVFAAATITWSLPSAYPGLRPVDGGVATYAHGTAVTEDGALATYTPNPYDTLYAVARRFHLTEDQLLWLNPGMIGEQAELKQGVPINLDPSRR
jgi:hypothetical protein